uniref:Uncharacterized protein n=1 Tax=Oryza nivara TaxID=4536 RepID=A0A0E0GAL4_ORYNI
MGTAVQAYRLQYNFRINIGVLLYYDLLPSTSARTTDSIDIFFTDEHSLYFVSESAPASHSRRARGDETPSWRKSGSAREGDLSRCKTEATQPPNSTTRAILASNPWADAPAARPLRRL